jgi:hypothetical protein
MSKPVVVHAGYYKTATTFLQKWVFGVAKLGFSALAPDTITDSVARVRYFGDAFILNENRRLISAWTLEVEGLRERIQHYISAAPGVPVISHERFLGYPFSSGFDAYQVLQRIKAAVPNARIVIVIREQHDLIVSTYFQYLRRGGLLSLQAALTRAYDNRFPGHFSPEYFKYHIAVQAYINAFGKENVLVVPYEMMRTEPETFYRRLFGFCGTEYVGLPNLHKVENVSHSRSVELAFRRLNVFLQKSSLNGYSNVSIGLPNSSLESMKRQLSAIVPRVIEDAVVRHVQRTLDARLPVDNFRESNQTLSRALGIDLARYGYAL